MNRKSSQFPSFLPKESEGALLQAELRPRRSKVPGQKLGSITPLIFGKFYEWKMKFWSENVKEIKLWEKAESK